VSAPAIAAGAVSMIRRLLLLLAAGLCVLGLGAIASPAAHAAERLTFGTDWRAQAEHGGFYQALATGLYSQRGLDVTIRQGGPQVNQAQLLAAGRIDAALVPNSFMPLNFVRENVPFVAVAAFFQKDPAVLIAHAGQGNDSFDALRGKPIMIGADTRIGSWQFLKQAFGYTDAQIRPYAFTLAPFLRDKTAVQQGYLGSEPFLLRRAGVEPVVLLLADAGYASYGALVVFNRRTVETRPDLVQRFVDASAAGWKSYLEGDPAPGNALIKRDNPEMTGDLLAYAIGAMKDHGIVLSGDALTLGIGAMTDARWRAFFTTMVEAGVYPAGLDWRRAFTLDFVGKSDGAGASR
jgi:ABC-type nitrate/sulfonate/bicarbonate transport systems, periplasmic components